MSDLDLERLAFLHRQGLEIDFLTTLDRECDRFLTAVVERDVLARLKEAQLADPLGREPAGGQVRNTPGRERESDVCDIDLLRKNRDAGRPSLFRGAPD